MITYNSKIEFLETEQRINVFLGFGRNPLIDLVLKRTVEEAGGEQPDDQAMPVDGAMSGGVPRSYASESEAK